MIKGGKGGEEEGRGVKGGRERLTEALAHLGQFREVDGVARKVNRVGFAIGGAERRGRDDEADDFAAREVHAGRASDLELAATDFEGDGFP